MSVSGTTRDSEIAEAVRLLASRPADAEARLRAIAAAHPDDVDASIFLSRALRAQGRSRRAIDVLRTLIARNPRSAAAHYELGLTHADRADNDNAVALYRQTLRLDPQFPNGWLVLADLLFDMDKKKAADSAYMQHVVRSARAEHIVAAVTALRANEFGRAEMILRKHLVGLPTDLATIAVLGETLARLGETEEALFLLARCLERAPSFDKARLNYATSLCRLSRADEAVAQVRILLQTKPKDPKCLVLLATALTMIGDTAQSIAIYEELLCDRADDGRVLTGYGQALRAAGRASEAVQAFRRAIAADPKNGEAYWCIANLKTARFSRAETDALKAIAARDDLNNEQRRHFCFALGQALEDDGQFAAAFTYYAKGNAHRFGELPYAMDAMQTRVRQLKALFTPEFMAAHAGEGATAADPIFIVGLPRAGSTLLEQMLDCHSAVEGTSELPYIRDIARRLGGDPWEMNAKSYPECLKSPQQWRALGEEYLALCRTQRESGKPLFTDKMPGNFEHIGFIRLILPNAKIIDARRHPLGCCLSNFKQLFSNGQRFSYDLTAMGIYYKDYVELMAHWDAVLPGFVHRVHHEDMVTDPEREVRRLLEFCGLPFEPACLRFHENSRQARTISSEQVRQPIFADGVDQWRHYEPWLGPLKEALGPILEVYPGTPF